MSLLQLYGPWALVTGASSGIGEQFANQLAEKGFQLLITARNEGRLQALQQKLQRDYGVEVKFIVVDLANEGAVQTILDGCAGLDIGLLINNAGYGYKGCFDQQAVSDIKAMIQVNSLVPMALTHSLLAKLRARKRSGIIFTGSIEGEMALPHSSAYAASKSFIHSLGGGLWEEERNNGVDVLVLAPGSTDTNAPISQGISRDQLVGLMSPGKVALQALASLGKRPLLIPGIHNRIFVRLLRWLPRATALRMAGAGMARAIAASRK